MKEYNKLVRDRIPEILAQSDLCAFFRSLSPSEYMKFLEKKLDEEVEEFHESKDVEELADILEVLIAITNEKGYSVDTLWAERLKKRTERGGFERKILLIGIEEAEVKNGED